jgi:quercetin dioxygenase-like cupin family protein
MNASMSTSIQGMFDSLSRIQNLEQSVNSPWDCEHIMRCIHAMNTSTLEELRINPDVVETLEENICMNICSNPKFQIAVFIIPAGCSLPLHDHPKMCVLSKLLTGSLTYGSYTPKPHLYGAGPISYQKEVLQKSFLDSGWILSADKGNFHELFAKETCVMLDALLPPYEYPDRPCNYYTALEVSDGDWRLETINEPDNLPHLVPYFGSKPTEINRHTSR